VAEELLLALDQGTTSSRAILFDLQGRKRAAAQREFTQHFPRPGWVEHDAEEIWWSQLEVAREVLDESGTAPERILSLGITNQRETVVLWERRTGRPVAPAIVWQDRRTADVCARLRERGIESWVQQRSGLRLDPYFAGTKLAWLLEEDPALRERAERGELAFGTVDSWLIWKLTGGRLHVTDVTNACRTLLFNLETHSWDEELLELFRIPRALLPEVRPSSGELGIVDAELLGAEVPIGGVAGDQQAALFGQACHEVGEAKNTYGTGCFLLLNTGRERVRSEHRLLTTVAWQIGEEICYALEGSIFVSGAVVQWLRDEMEMIETAADVEALAASAPDHGGVVFVPAFAGLGAPHWVAEARGTIFGLTRGTSRGQLARAALHAIALQSWDVARAMARDSGLELRELRADGGGAGNDLLMQLQADILDASVIRPDEVEATALGAAGLAGLAAGVWSSPGEFRRHWREDRRWEPEATSSWREGIREEWDRAVDAARHWAKGTGTREA